MEFDNEIVNKLVELDSELLLDVLLPGYDKEADISDMFEDETFKSPIEIRKYCKEALQRQIKNDNSNYDFKSVRKYGEFEDSESLCLIDEDLIRFALLANTGYSVDELENMSIEELKITLTNICRYMRKKIDV